MFVWEGSAYERYVGRWSRVVAREFLDWLGAPGGKRWLDVGCGTGALSEAILQDAAPSEVIGCDPTAAMAAHALAHVTHARASFEVADARDLLATFPADLRTSVQQVQAFSGGGFRNANVQFLIAGPDIAKLTEYSEKIAAKMKTVPDAVDVDSTLISGKPEVQLEVDRDTAADLGVRVGDVSQALSTLIAGQEATTFNQGTDQYEVRVRAINPFRTSVEG